MIGEILFFWRGAGHSDAEKATVMNDIFLFSFLRDC